MVTFKQYLEESVQASDVYSFYALEFILFAGNKVMFEPEELDQIKGRYDGLEYRIYQDICADGIRAILREAGHGDMEIENIDDFIGTSAEDFVAEAHNYRQVESTENLSEIDMNNIKKAVETFFHSIDGGVLEALKMAREVFYEWIWTSGYGGDAWGNITDEMIKFYKLNPNEITSDHIDHMLDLIHNNSNWLDKFPEGGAVRKALNAKRDARTPHEFKDKIRDRQIRKWLGKALMGMDKTDYRDKALLKTGISKKGLSLMARNKVKTHLDTGLNYNFAVKPTIQFEWGHTGLKKIFPDVGYDMFMFLIDCDHKLGMSEKYKSDLYFSFFYKGEENVKRLLSLMVHTNDMNTVVTSFVNEYNDLVNLYPDGQQGMWAILKDVIIESFNYTIENKNKKRRAGNLLPELTDDNVEIKMPKINESDVRPKGEITDARLSS